MEGEPGSSAKVASLAKDAHVIASRAKTPEDIMTAFNENEEVSRNFLTLFLIRTVRSNTQLQNFKTLKTLSVW